MCIGEWFGRRLRTPFHRQPKATPRERPKPGPAAAFIDEILQSDRKAPRKQRHTAHRIWVRLRQEMPAVGLAESTVRRYVAETETEAGAGVGRRRDIHPAELSLGAGSPGGLV